MSEGRKAPRGLPAAMQVEANVLIIQARSPFRSRVSASLVRGQLVLVLILVPLLLHAQPQPEADNGLAEALERVYLETDYQRELPRAPEREVPAWAEWLAKFLQRLEGLSALGQVLAWASLAALVLALVFCLANLDYGRLGIRLRSRLRPARLSDEADSPAAAPKDWLRAADSLAGKMQYGAAVHALLLGVLHWMRSRGIQEWPPAATAREILAEHGGGRKSLEFLVRSAELAHFGGWGGSLSDYQACRTCAMELTAAGPAAK